MSNYPGMPLSKLLKQSGLAIQSSTLSRRHISRPLRAFNIMNIIETRIQEHR